ncbi:MAG: EFR1 family ferrodoxin, partial [Desulfocucumaceae bacterium]
MSYNDVTIYSMSGTGNSLRAAIWMRDEAVKRGVAARVIPVEKGYTAKATKDVPGSLLGLVMPTHGFIAHW